MDGGDIQMAKRAWNNMPHNMGWGKRAWKNLQSAGWGKRVSDSYADKRAWQKFQVRTIKIRKPTHTHAHKGILTMLNI